mmetsp:Transcript_101925/g.263423  ORF Transcript_101925/g.263423 Transcript_101925/m.263423 type:complete len:450 (-) Transcript_101925:104-1453(-)
MTSRSAVLVENVAQALSRAIEDPSGHSSCNTSVFTNLGSDKICSKRRRGADETKQAATVFDSSVIPPIGISAYLLRLSATFRCSDATFIAALIVVDRLLGYDGGRLPLTMRNVHRLFLGSLVVAVKYHEDLVYTNSHYAKSGGVRLREVNRLERTLLTALDFDLGVSPETYRLYEATLLNFSRSSPPEVRSPGGLGSLQKPADPALGCPHKAAAAPDAAAASVSTTTRDAVPGTDSDETNNKMTPEETDPTGDKEEESAASESTAAPEEDQQGTDAAGGGDERRPADNAGAGAVAGSAVVAKAADAGEAVGVQKPVAAMGGSVCMAVAADGCPAKTSVTVCPAAHVAALPGVNAGGMLGRPPGRGGLAEHTTRSRCGAYTDMLKAHTESVKDFGELVTIVNGNGFNNGFNGGEHRALIAGSARVQCAPVDITPPPPWAPNPQRAVLGLP